MTTTAPPSARPALRTDWRASAGITLVEILVAMVIAGITATIALSVLVSTGLLVTRSMATTTTLSQLEDASGQLLRDVNDGRRIVIAEPHALTVQVTRDSVCTERAWTVEGGDLVVTTDTFSTERCTGGAETARMEVVQGNLTGATFHYYSALSQSNAMPAPVSLNDVTRVTWDLAALPPYPDAREVEISSGAAFTGRGASSDGTGAVQDATRPVLQVTTARAGVDKPALKWTDTSPELAKSWTVYRIANPEGTGSGTATTWEAVMQLGPGLLTWTDTTLPAGYTAQYTVQATLTDGRAGPTSNQVSTGLRPAAPTLTATGKQAFIALSWMRPAGSSEYDVYRDGVLVAPWAQIEREAAVSSTRLEWTDTTGAGHAHTYAVVAVNRWERGATDSAGATSAGAQRNVVPAGTAVTAELGEPGLKAARLASVAAGAWSAPLAPTGLTVTNRLPGDQANVASTWDTTVDIRWTASGWTGAYADAARAATRYSVARAGASIRTGLSTTSSTDTGAPRGATSAYVVTASTVAPHALTGAGTMSTLLTWPAAPTCTATPGGGGYPATRAAAVTVTGPAGQTVAAYRQRIASGEIRGAGSSAWIELTHGTAHAWRGQSQNAAGWGPWSGECGITTQRLTVDTPARPTCTATRDAQYAPTTVRFSSNGTLSRTTTAASVAGYYSASTSATNTNTDGYNTVSASSYSSCGVTVEQRPVPSNTGATPGAPSATCAPYRSQGKVVDGLNASMSGASAGVGFSIGGPKSGSYSADHGTYISGSANDRSLSCSFFRAHPIYYSYDGSPVDLDYWASMRWNMSAGGAV